MSWFLNHIRSKRERRHQQQVRLLQQQQKNRILAIEKKYREKNFFEIPESETDEGEAGMLADARENYLLYLLNRVGIDFIPKDAQILARQRGPAIAADRVCRLLGLDYHKIAAVAPRVATETARVTTYFREIQHSCEITGISSDPLLPHIHFGSHDIRDILFESFRATTRIIEMYDKLGNGLKTYIDWPSNRSAFVNQWTEISPQCLMLYYDQGRILGEYQKILDEGTETLLSQCTQYDPQLEEKWLQDDAIEIWQRFPDFEVLKIQTHLANRVREVNYLCGREWIRLLKKLTDTEFDFQVSVEEIETEEH